MPLPDAVTEKVAVSLSPMRADVGWLLMETVLMANVEALEVSERETPFSTLVITTWYEPFCVAK